jgi:hypothetical protein
MMEGKSLGQLFAEMNQQHAVLPIGGKTRVATWGEDLEFPGYQTITRFASFADFRALHDKYRVKWRSKDAKGNDKIVEEGRGTWWLNQPNRRQYDGGMRFMPECNETVVNGDTLNMWSGFGVEARKPNGYSGARGCRLLLDHGRKIICSGNEEHYDYLIKREAFIVQRRTRSEVAVGLHTEEEGTGKGLWTRAFNRLFGVHAMQVQKPEHVIGKHNKHLEILLRLSADEALFALDPRHRNALFDLITEPTNTIEPKFVDSYPALNYVNIDVLSNAAHFLPVSGTARRFMVPTVSPDRKGDHAYFRQMQAQLIDDGGYEALLYHLQYEIDIRDFNVRDVPKTAALAEQAALSRRGVDALVEHACNEGRVPCQHDNNKMPAGFTNCSGRYGFDYAIEHHNDLELRRLGPLKVKHQLKKWGRMTGDTTRRQIHGRRTNGIMWPSLEDLRFEFEEKFGKQKWLRPTVKVWIR